ncbi:hypothetical protein FOCG_06211 [Fusarium oxysporum f. sp. radicis-lycopersici 26381]|nr:hypothetical protein FOCG_06211 [Fusarium oxysporum f. sp. radicis-lycopersici 26381]
MATSKDGKKFDLAKELVVSGPPKGEDSFLRDLKVFPVRIRRPRFPVFDEGPSTYAMQWYQDEAGHDLAITWMANWPSPKWPSRVNGWAGQQSITREMFTCKDGGSGQHPILELKTLASGRAKEIRTAKVTRKGLHINSSNKWTSS